MRSSLLFFTVVSFILSSCVAKRKYDELLAQKVRIEADLAEKEARLAQVNSDLDELEDELVSLKNDTAHLANNLRAAASKLSLLENEHDQLNTHYKNLLSNSGRLNRDIAQQQEQLAAIQENLERTRKLNDSLSNSLAERERNIRELEQVLARKDKAVVDLRNRISSALLNFKESDISVRVKNGKVYVSLAEQLLFGSGSIEVDQKGVRALEQLAKAIKDQKDLNIVIEGHTDNVPVSRKSPYMQDNWDLSVMRATTIAKILTRSGVTPSQITAAGRGEYSPLMLNDSPENKQKNRRTEIIITPNLDELFRILETN